MDDPQFDPLIEEATHARLKAYAPYSHFRVGAAVRTRSGKIFHGCNIENSSYGATICAERVALGNAYAAGERDIEAMAIVTDTTPPSPPCGICRQVIKELGGNIPILLANVAGETRRFITDDLLPEAFMGNMLSQD
ncbi:cytidine deaminase [candidate division KSB3 bacterium]|jgi:cytidine deaminase|uniref:Cytidine deaminase n=1 Tax=candidate division KSB3 bacterium TaxID=2044937 RepID=A0A9D5Q6D9_9BACT|nr:cytidine deaminase [candidate division KSB3 bacterium]MBD3325635.1 cytidine deaminase [candidate division KSB3 bacterium]